MPDTLPPPEPVKIGIVSISDRASGGVYEDKGLPALNDWLKRALHNPIAFEPRLIPDDQATISATLIELVDAGCSLVLTTGGTGPALRDVTPEATLAVADKEMPVPHHQPAGPAQGHCRDARRPAGYARHLRGRALLHRPAQRAVPGNARRRVQGLPAQDGHAARAAGLIVKSTSSACLSSAGSYRF
jgi:hypothetical protein